jgi:hypothetical protein
MILMDLFNTPPGVGGVSEAGDEGGGAGLYSLTF